MTTPLDPGYSSAQIGLHWLIAGLVAFQLAFGESMAEAFEAAEDGAPVSSADVLLSGAHYWIGVGILVLAGLRLLLRLRRGAPAEPAAGMSFGRAAAGAVHGLFYVLLFVVPLLGLLAVHVAEDLGDAHALAKPLFLGLIVIHASAALVHQFVLKDGTLRRMLSPGPAPATRYPEA